MRAACLLLLIAGCSRDYTRTCSVDEDCVQGGIPGICRPSPTSSDDWCAFQDSSCSSGYRWGVLAGDGLDKVCLDEAAGQDAAPDGLAEADATAAIDADEGVIDAAVDEVPMVPVTGGSFMMGCNFSVDTSCATDEEPYHLITLTDYEIDLTEVTQGSYQLCIDAGSCLAPTGGVPFDPLGTPALPVDASWQEAGTYCAWKGKRLPTEAEWEMAARGVDGRIYPWGNSAPDCTRANMPGCAGTVEAVGSHPSGASPWGALDMAGNLYEWVSDYYQADYYATSPAYDPQGPPSGTLRVGRGGSYSSAALRTSARLRPLNGAGVRCARTLP